MSLGLLIRIALVMGWLGIVSVHVIQHTLPALGVSERRDFSATLTQQIDRTLIYAVRTNTKDIGHCTLTFAREDAGYRQETRINLDRLPGLPDVPIPGFDSGSPRLNAIASQTYDERMNLTGLTGSGNVFGMKVTIDATIDHRGLIGTIDLSGQKSLLEVPEMNETSGQGFGFALSLPPGLIVGERFKTTVTDMDMTMTPKRAVVVFDVATTETIATTGGSLDLLRVEMVKDGNPSGTLWCDNKGTVYRMQLARTDCTLELTSITHTLDGQTWPQERRP